MQNEIAEGLRIMSEQTKAHEIEWKLQAKSKDKTYAIFVPYIDARALIKRLSEAFSNCWSKKTEYMCPLEMNGKVEHMFRTTISVKSLEEIIEISRDGYAPATDIEPTKGGESDSFKRAGVMFGFGIDLYSFPEVRVELNQAGYAPFNMDKAFETVYHVYRSGQVSSSDTVMITQKLTVHLVEYGKPGKELKATPSKAAPVTDAVEEEKKPLVLPNTLEEVQRGLFQGKGTIKPTDFGKIIDNWIENGAVLMYHMYIYTYKDGKLYFWALNEHQLRTAKSQAKSTVG